MAKQKKKKEKQDSEKIQGVIKDIEKKEISTGKMFILTVEHTKGSMSISGFGQPPQPVQQAYLEEYEVEVEYVENTKGDKTYYNFKGITVLDRGQDEAEDDVKPRVEVVDEGEKQETGFPEEFTVEHETHGTQVVETASSQSQQIQMQETNQGFLEPATDLDTAVDRFKKFEEAKQKLLSEGSDIVRFGKDGRRVKRGGRPYIAKSGWRKLARFFGLSYEIIRRQKLEQESGGYMWVATARVSHPSGASVVAEGACISSNPFFTKGGRKKADESNILLTAESQAVNRGISDLLGSGEVSAEEMM